MNLGNIMFSKRMSAIEKRLRPLMSSGVCEAEYFRQFAEHLKTARKYHSGKASEYRTKNPERFRVLGRADYSKHAERRRGMAKRYRVERKQSTERTERYRAWCRRNVKNKKATDPQFKIRFLMRNRIWMALQRGVAKSGSTVELVGCSMAEFKSHIESRWLNGMSWENYGKHGWHLDHIRPCNSFDLTDPTQQRICFHHSNVRPLWAKDNLSKGSTYHP